MKECQQCGKPFSGHANARFCGDECRSVFKRAYMDAWMASHPRPRKEPKPNPIEPFPAEIDREAFGHWLSGFVDGEATFALRVPRCRGRDRFQTIAYLRITVRDDDSETLRLVQSFWACGRLYHSDNQRCRVANAKPVLIYSVHSTGDLARCVVPHFERFPLRAKKRNDFLIWRQGVELMAAVLARPRIYRQGPRTNRHGGTFPKWTDAEKERFRALTADLVAGRRYVNGYAP